MCGIFVANIATAGVWLFAGAGAVVSGSGRSFVIDVEGMPFALRFVILAVIAAAMGWGLGAGVSWLTRGPFGKSIWRWRFSSP